MFFFVFIFIVFFVLVPFFVSSSLGNDEGNCNEDYQSRSDPEPWDF